MATYKASGGGDFQKAPEGTHVGVCTLVADVGLQPGSGQYPDPKVKIYLRFELPGERVSIDGKDLPQIIYSNYTASMSSKANLRKIVESWRGKAMTDQEAELFDVRNLLGHACLVQVVHSADGQYANVKNVMALPRGTAKPKAEGKLVYYGPDDDAQYADVPNWLQQKIDKQLSPAQAAKPPPPLNAPRAAAPSMAADEQEASRAAAMAEDPDDIIPF